MPRRKNPTIKKNQELVFQCPKCGHIHKDDVDVWCNRCKQEKMIFKNDMYLCPKCFSNETGNFTCRRCGSNRVKMASVSKKRVKKK